MEALLLFIRLLAAVCAAGGVLQALLSCNKDDKVWKSGLTIAMFGLGLKIFVE